MTTKIYMEAESGSIMIVTLIIFMIIGVLALSLLNTGIMEFRSSRYDGNLQQAQQGADGGVEWGLESIYMELNQPENLVVYELPDHLACGNNGLDIGFQGCQASIGEVVKIGEAGTEPDQVVYSFTVFADYNGAHRGVEAEVTYGFSGGYEIIGEDGEQEFVPRVYLDRGRISSYRYNFE
ncbi:MAG: pilus assembly PilX N-terminal domain-containing protein [Syntrophomonadaceae bacterium]